MLLVSGSPGLTGVIDGSNVVFEAEQMVPEAALVSINGLTRAPGDATSNGYRLDGRKVVLKEPLVVGDILTVYIPPSANESPPVVMRPGGPRPGAGMADVLMPAGSAQAHAGSLSGSAMALRPTLTALPPKQTGSITGSAQRN